MFEKYNDEIMEKNCQREGDVLECDGQCTLATSYCKDKPPLSFGAGVIRLSTERRIIADFETQRADKARALACILNAIEEAANITSEKEKECINW